jgi:hypothetical protein
MARHLHTAGRMDHRADSPSPCSELQLQTRELLDSTSDLDVSIVELIVAASECSDDAYEIGDIVDGLVDSGRLRIRRRDADPMLAQSF